MISLSATAITCASQKPIQEYESILRKHALNVRVAVNAANSPWKISPGYIRIGRVRQGDQGSVKRRLSYQRVDEVTQFEVVCSAKKIREQQKPRGKPSCLTLDFLVSLESKAFNRNFIHPLFAPRGGE